MSSDPHDDGGLVSMETHPTPQGGHPTPNNHKQGATPGATPAVSGVPMDTGWAWVVAAASFVIQFISVGFGKSFGILFVAFIEHYNSNNGDASWILSLNVLLCMMLGPITTSLGLRVTNRVVLFVGGVLMCVGYLGSAFSSDIRHLYITHGVIVGISFSFTYAPSILVIAEYFEKRRSLANGIAAAGSGLGNLVIPVFTQRLLDMWGLSGSLIILAGVGLNVCVASMLLRPLSFYTRPRKSFKSRDDTDNHKDTQHLGNITMATVRPSSKDSQHMLAMTTDYEDSQCLVTTTMGNSDCQRLVNRATQPQVNGGRPSAVAANQNLRSLYYASVGDVAHGSVQSLHTIDHVMTEYDSKHRWVEDQTPSEKSHNCICPQACLDIYHKLLFLPAGPDQKPKPVFDCSLVYNLHFLVFFVSAFFSCMGYVNVVVMVPPLARDNKLLKWEAATVVSLIGGADFIGRLFFGWFADLNHLSKLHQVVLTMGASGAAVVLMPVLPMFWGQCLLGVLFGLFGGAYIALTPVMLVDSLGVEKFPNTFGLTMVAMGVSCMVSILAFSYLRDLMGNWNLAFYIAGVSLIVGAGILLLERPAKRHQQKQRDRRQTDATA